MNRKNWYKEALFKDVFKCKNQGEFNNTYASAYKIVTAKSWHDVNSHIHTYS